MARATRAIPQYDKFGTNQYVEFGALIRENGMHVQ